MLTLATLTKTVRAHAPNPSMSNEEALNALIGPCVRAGRVRNRRGDELYLDKQRTSRIMSSKDDVPQRLRQLLGRIDIEEAVTDDIRVCISELVAPLEVSVLEREVLALLDEGDPRRTVLEERRDDPPAFLSCALLEAIRANNRSNRADVLWSLGTGSLSIRVGDLLDVGFKNRARTRPIVVVPVDTSFETHVDDAGSGDAHGISPRSIHGQWLNRMSASGMKRWDIERRIKLSLARKVGKPDEKGRFPRGTTVEFVTQKAVYYLVALADLNEEGTALCTREDVSSALQALAAYYDRRGQAAPLYLPLMGTGLSRANLGAGDALSFTIDAFTKGNHLPKGAVTIVVHKEMASSLDVLLG